MLPTPPLIATEKNALLGYSSNRRVVLVKHYLSTAGRHLYEHFKAIFYDISSFGVMGVRDLHFRVINFNENNLKFPAPP